MTQFKYFRIIEGSAHYYLQVEEWKLSKVEELDQIIVAEEAVQCGIIEKLSKHSVEVVQISPSEYDVSTEFKRLEDEHCRAAMLDIAETLNEILTEAKADWKEFKKLAKALNDIAHG